MPAPSSTAPPAAGSRSPPSDPLARLALLLAVVALALTGAELYRAGIPLGPLRKPLVYQLAGVAALSGAAWLWRRAGRRALPACLAAVVFALYLTNDQRLMSGDTMPSTLIPYAVVRHGTLALDGLVPDGPIPYWVQQRRGHLWSRYPVATGLLALPVYLPAAIGPGVAGALPHAEKLAAAAMAAASAGFVLATFLRLAMPIGVAVIAALAYAFGSSVFSTAAQALWQHTSGVLAISAAIWCTVRSRSDARLEPWAGLCAGLSVAARATNVLAAAALIAWHAPRGARPLLRALAGAAGPLLLLALYDAFVFGAPWRTGYAVQWSDFGLQGGAGLLGVLLSPTRGLLPYVPWAPLAILGLALGARRDRLAGLALAAVAAILAVHALWIDWAGGWCFGPRLVCDATPLLALGLQPLLSVPHRRWSLPALVAAGLFAASLSWLGAYRQDAPLARDVYLGDGRHAMEWWRYPPLRIAADLRRR